MFVETPNKVYFQECKCVSNASVKSMTEMKPGDMESEDLIDMVRNGHSLENVFESVCLGPSA